jgi:hypothetical protein
MDPEEYANYSQNYQRYMNSIVLQTGIALAVALGSDNSKHRRFGVRERNKKREEKGILTFKYILQAYINKYPPF